MTTTTLPPIQGPPAEPESARPARRGHTVALLVIFYYLTFVSGVRSIRSLDPSPLDQLVSFAMCLTLGWWAVVDARRRGHPLPLLSHAWFTLLGGLLVPAYYLRSRGWRGVAWLIGNVLLWLILANAVAILGWKLVYGLRAAGGA